MQQVVVARQLITHPAAVNKHEAQVCRFRGDIWHRPERRSTQLKDIPGCLLQRNLSESATLHPCYVPTVHPILTGVDLGHTIFNGSSVTAAREAASLSCRRGVACKTLLTASSIDDIGLYR